MKNYTLSLSVVLVLCVITGFTSYFVAKSTSTKASNSNKQVNLDEVNSRLENLEKQTTKAINMLSQLEINLQHQTRSIEETYSDQKYGQADLKTEITDEYSYSYEAKNNTQEGTQLSANDIISIETKIYDSLSMPSTNLSSITKLKDYKMLPITKRREIIDEITRRINEGEIDKSQFIPHYRQR
ncbi:MAG: hypothetical protein KAS57_07605 [Gammaproteobacteria bacterium]|nr:hypothetical protein [Gammaproteobacteria bacterium]